MSTWPVQVAEARFRELLEKSTSDEPQLVTGDVRRLRLCFPELSGMHRKARAQWTLHDFSLEQAGPTMDAWQVPERGPTRWRLAGFDLPA